MLPGGGFQGYGGAIAEVGDTDSAFSHRETLVEFFAGSTWADPTEDAVRMSGARAWAAALAPFSSGTYVNVIADPGEEGVGRAYHAAQLERLAEIKRTYDPDNVFHLNQNIRPAASTDLVASRSSVRGTVGSCRTTPDASYSRGMSAVRDRCPACARRLITTRFDTTFRLPDRSERLCFGIPGGLCEDCSQLYIDPELIELLDLGEGRCVFAIESDLVVQEQAWSSGH